MAKVETSSVVRGSRPRVYSDTVGDSMTQQEFVSECDINVQIARFQGLGISPFRPFSADDVRDLSEMSADFMEANEVIAAARAAFDELPEKLQQRFSGSPAAFMDFVDRMAIDPAARKEAVDLGILATLPVSEPPAEPVGPAGGGDGKGAVS